jgi:uncharacterized protein (DUF983 family)
MRDAIRKRAGDFAAIVVLFVIGFAMVALADALEAWWPLFVTPVPYAAIAWLVVRGDDEDLGAQAPD